MALSSVSYLGDGSNKLFSITFPYLSKSHVKVLVNGVEDTTFTWVTTGSINTTNTPVAGSIVVIKRETPTAPLVDFVDGSTLTEKLLDMSTAQSLFVAEESNDSITQLMQVDLNDNKFDGLNKVVKNVADPVEPQDVATKEWTEETIAVNGIQAALSATASAASAATATTKASEASTSASNALASAASAASIYDSFDDRYLGSKTSDPTTDNDGDVLLNGALYWNTSVVQMRVYNAATTSWLAAYVPSSEFLQNTDIGVLVQAYDAAIAKRNQVQNWSAGQSGAIASLTDNASVALNLALANNFSLLMTSGVGASRQLANPTNAVAGQSGLIIVTQDASGSRLLTYGSNYKFAGGTAPSLTTTANAVDYLSYFVESPTRIFISPAKDVK